MNTTLYLIVYDLGKSQASQHRVIAARAGIQCFDDLLNDWTPVFTGLTTFCEIIMIISKDIR